MPRQIFLLVFPAAGASKINGTRAHWAILVPESGSSTKGTVIHVVGTPFTGYGLEFKRNYDVIETSRKYYQLPLAMADGKHVQDYQGGTAQSKDITPLNTMEVE